MPVTTPAKAFVGEAGAVVAYDLQNPKKVTSKDRRGRNVTTTVMTKLWTLANASIQKVPAGNAYKKFLAANPLAIDLKAGKRLYGHQGSLLFAVDLPVAGKAGQVTWKTTITGTPGSQIAADGRLFVTTAEGRLLCFSAEKGPGDVSQSLIHI